MKGEAKVDRESSEKLLNAIGELPEDMVAEAADRAKINDICKKNRRRYLFRVGRGLAAAAVIGIVVWGICVSGRIPFLGGDRERNEMKGGFASQDVCEKSSEESFRSVKIFGRESARKKFGIGFTDSEMTEDGEKTKSSAGGESTGQESSKAVPEQSDEDIASDIMGETDTDIFRIYPDISEKEKKRLVQVEMELGKTGESREYYLTASEGISFLTSSYSGHKGEQTGQIEDIEGAAEYQYRSGTQITFTLTEQKNGDTGFTEEIPAQIRDEWNGIGMKPMGYIKVRVEEETGEEKEVIILIGKKKAGYYAEFFRQ